MLWLGKKPMADCIACGHCFKTGHCMFKDQVNEIIDRFDEFGGLVAGSPVYYGGANGRLTSFLTRLLFASSRGPLAKDDQGHSKRTGMLAAAVVSCRRSGATATFQRINMFFQMCNMHVVSSSYWNNVHGYTAEDVEKDSEGLQVMRTLGKNMAWLLKSIEAGKQQGIELAPYEERAITNFIR